MFNNLPRSIRVLAPIVRTGNLVSSGIPEGTRKADLRRTKLLRYGKAL
jgi:hypothetical protein